MRDLATNDARAIDAAHANSPAALAESARAYVDARRLIAAGHDWAAMREAAPAGASLRAGRDAVVACGVYDADHTITAYGRLVQAAIRVARALGWGR